MNFYSVDESLLLKDFQHFSPELLSSYFREYKISIQQLNSLRAELQTLRNQQKSNSNLYRDRAKSLQSEYSHLFLLELFLKGLSQNKCQMDNLLMSKITESYGSFDMWKNDFYHLSQTRNIQFLVLCYNKHLDCCENLILQSNTSVAQYLTPLLSCYLPKGACTHDSNIDSRQSFIQSYLFHANYLFASHNLRLAL